MALTDKLSAIADAIRAKTGKTDGLTLEQMPTEIASITGGGSAEGCVTVTFMNGDTELFSRPVYIGDDCPNPVDQNRIDTPTKESTAQYNYVFYGWGASDGGAADNDILKNITEDKTVYAVFTAVVRSYTITWLDEDGTTVLKTEQVAYGSVPSYAPQKDGVGVDKWTPEPVAVTDNASYIVTWASLLDFASMSWSDIDAAVQAGKAKLFVLGATKTYVEPKYNYECIAQIVGIEQDDLADGSGKAGLTIASEKASSPSTSKWTTSADYTMDWLSSTPQTNSTFAKSMSSSSFELKTIAKLVKKTHYAADGTYQSNDVQWFIPSRREITGEGYNEGEQYQYYVGGWVGKLLAAKLWTRTKQSYSTGKVYYLSNTSTTQSTAQQNATTTCSAVTYFCI